MIVLFLVALLVAPVVASAQTSDEFFDARTLHEVRLYIHSGDLREMRERYQEDTYVSRRFRMARHAHAQCRRARARARDPQRHQARPENRFQPVCRGPDVSRHALGRPRQCIERRVDDPRTRQHGVHQADGAAGAPRVFWPPLHQRCVRGALCLRRIGRQRVSCERDG